MKNPKIESLFPSIFFEPPQPVDRRNILYHVIFLIFLLGLVVPLVTLSTGMSPLVMVIGAIIFYVTMIVLTDTVFGGLCAAVLVLSTFSANFPLTGIQTKLGVLIQLNLLLVDIAAVPLAILFLRWTSIRSHLRERRLDMVASYALAGVVVWATLAAIVSNGPSQFAAFVYAFAQLRYLLLFGVAVGIVRYTGIRTTVYSLLLAVGGNMLYAIAEVLNQGTIGLSHLGDANGVTLGMFYIGPLGFQTSMYAGGFVGTSRTLVALIILFSPLVIERIVRGSTGQQIVSFIYLFAGVFLVRVSGSDTGWMALTLTLLLLIGLLVYVGVSSNILSSAFAVRRYLYGCVSTLGAVIVVNLLFINDGILTFKKNTDPDLSTGNNPQEVSKLVNNDAQLLPDYISSIVNQVPLVNSANLSIRILQYTAAIKIGIVYPLFGVGGRNFRFVAKSYGVPRRISLHNIYMSYLVSTGIPGMLLFLSSIGATLAIAISKTIEDHNDNQLLWGTIVCGIIGFSAYNFWSSAHGGAATYMTFWVLAGTVVGAYRLSDGVKKSKGSATSVSN